MKRYAAQRAGPYLCQQRVIVLQGVVDHLLGGVQVGQQLAELHGCKQTRMKRHCIKNGKGM